MEGAGLRSVYEKQGLTYLVPQGRLNLAQDAVLGTSMKHELVPRGRLNLAQDAVLGTS
jgi:hypothetical protein